MKVIFFSKIDTCDFIFFSFFFFFDTCDFFSVNVMVLRAKQLGPHDDAIIWIHYIIVVVDVIVTILLFYSNRA